MALRRTVAALATFATVCAGVLAWHMGGAAAAVETYPAPAGGVWTVDGHGFGHGHGLSQYGAHGAAKAGLTAQQIVAFYYPGTTLTTTPDNPIIRVDIANMGRYTTVVAKTGLYVVGSVDLVATGATQWRIVPEGTAGLKVQKLVGTTWSDFKTGLSGRVDIGSRDGIVRMVMGDATQTEYHGSIGAVRYNAGELTINRLRLEDYVAGSVPREMPSSWEVAATGAQAIAARTYARSSIAEGNTTYDICDNSNCQMYGGMRHYDAGGTLQWTDLPSAANVTTRQVLMYGGAPAFAQYSASNGGWTVDGGQPYLVAKADPYAANADDPFFAWTRTVNVSDVAAYYGLAKVTAIQITGRDGNGDWGGRVTSAVVQGVDGSGATVNRSVSGFSIGDAMGLPHNWFKIRQSPAPKGHLDSVTTSIRMVRVRGWAMDPANLGQSTTVEVVAAGTHATSLARYPRPDVQRVYATPIDAYGYDVSVPIPDGTSRVCVYAHDITGKLYTNLGCRDVVAPVDPTGRIDVAQAATGGIKVGGWALDPDSNGGTTSVKVSVDTKVYTIAASGARADVQRAYHLVNGSVGYGITAPAAAGAHKVCVTGVNNAGAGTDASLGCVTVRV